MSLECLGIGLALTYAIFASARLSGPLPRGVETGGAPAPIRRARGEADAGG
jgi:hypothetical protein